MKKSYYLFATLVMVAFMSLTSSCSKDDDDSKINTGYNESWYDPVGYFMSYFYKTDQWGNLVERYYGETLDPTDSTHLYIGVDSKEEALQLFKIWCYEWDKYYSYLGDDYIYYLYDEYNEKYGELKYTVPETTRSADGMDVLGEIELPNWIANPIVSKITFVSNASWPNSQMTVSPYKIGDTENAETMHDGVQKFLCIREAKNGTPGLLVYLSESTDYKWREDVSPFSVSDNADIARCMWGEKGEKWDYYVKLFKEKCNRKVHTGYDYWVNRERLGFAWALSLTDRCTKAFSQIRTKAYIQCIVFQPISRDDD